MTARHHDRRSGGEDERVSRYRVRAPALTSRGGWVNTGGRALSLAELRGKIVLLDFWTAGCANCLHVLDELRPLESTYADVLAVIGIHSPKFAHESEDRSVLAAVERYEVRHPVLSDPDLALWQQYAIKAWPTLVLIDPAGYVVAQAAGEGQVSGLARIIDELVVEFDGQLRRGGDAYVVPDEAAQPLRFPAKAIRVGDSLLVADAGHHQLLELDLDAATVLRRIGTGRRGHADGHDPSFAEPNGLAQLPDGTVAVADTANHRLRLVRMTDGAVIRSVALGHRGLRTITGAVPDVVSPWDVAWWPALDRLVIAAAGVHLLLSWDPVTDEVAILAGTTVEGLRDGPALDGWLAQPSGLAVDGDRLWFVDAESSALRSLDLDGQLRTWVGEGLFDFGHVDGPADQARLQHPLGVAVLPDESIAIADTYNGAVRRYADGVVSTLVDGLDEPSGLLVVDGELVVVESAAHRLVRRPDLGPEHEEHHDQAMAAARPVTALAAGVVRLRVEFTAPPGRKLDDREGPSARLAVTASPPALLVTGGGPGTELEREIVLAPGTGVLNVTAQAAACDDDPAVEHPACYLSRQDWGIPVTIGAGSGDLRLVLMG
jgi:thiol-disulfide isomerase/thioredoxin